ncbi:TerB N-terminal domain-containing protein [Pseudomonas syringae]|uniref:tellurite resistance TerB family protein n=1 Tax=Pseudomonas syringae TaxID=317 RepID=UPI003B029B2F
MAPSRPSTPFAGSTPLHADDIRHGTGASDECLPATTQTRAVESDTENLAMGRFARFSRASSLVGGTQPVPTPVRTHAFGIGDYASLAIGRYARFSRPSSNLIGGTQPQRDVVTSVQKSVSAAPQPASSTLNLEFFTVRQGSPDSGSFSIPKAPAHTDKLRWLRPGEPVTVAGITLSDGMIYTGAKNPRFRQSEPSFIDTSLKVATSHVDLATTLTFYWSTYDDLDPKERRGYLQWLAGGRCDPKAGSGYVFMFFHGLERRLLVDTQSDAEAREDCIAIKAEIERLISLYYQHASFCSQALRLLEHLDMPAISERMYLLEPPTKSAGRYEMPTLTRVALGQMAKDKYPLNSGWALAWAMTDPNISRRKPIVRCSDLFQRLFKAEYTQRYPGGLKVLNNKTRLRITYPASSPYLDVPPIPVGDLPDVSVTSGIRKKLQPIVEECTELLTPFSRYVGRNVETPDKYDALEGLLLLPIFLWPEYAKHELEKLQSDVDSDAIALTFNELAQRFKSDGALPRNQITALARVLEGLNIGMEPDVLAGSRAKTEEHVVLFETGPDEPALRATTDYSVALTTLDIATSVAASEGTNQAQSALLDQHIDSWTHFSVTHRKRLKAYQLLQRLQPPTLSSLKKRIAALQHDEKRTIGYFLAQLAQADGTVTPQQVKLLERAYKALQLDTTSLYSDLHGAASSASGGIISARRSLPASTGADGKKQGSGIVLDMHKVAQLQRETAAVSALLANVFKGDQEDEQISAEATAQNASDAETHLYGLDTEHSAFLRLLVSRNAWTRQALENATATMDLMLDGALEQINDMAFELFDMPVSEGDDPIEINPDILSELTL